MKPFKTIKERAEIEFVEKKSRFIGYASPAASEEEAVRFVEELKKRHKDATHNVYAYVLTGGQKRYSDDGEPSQTAGGAALSVMEKEEIVNACVVVTRYFGGTLLGRGGLIRAYQKGAKDALFAAGVAQMVPYDILTVETDYALLNLVNYEIKTASLEVLDTKYESGVVLTVKADAQKTDVFCAALLEKTNAGVIIKKTDTVYGAKKDGEA